MRVIRFCAAVLVIAVAVAVALSLGLLLLGEIAKLVHTLVKP